MIVEHYTRDSESGSYTKIKTETAKFKEGQTWRASKNLAILFDHNFDKVESTASGNATYGSVVAGTTTTVKFYYTRYIKSAYLVVNFYNTVDGSRIKTPMKYHLRDGDSYSIPATAVLGYELDTDRYPGMTIGTFDASNPISFNFYYKALTNNTTRVHYYNAKKWGYVLCYCYDDNGIEAMGAWADQKKRDAMKEDKSMGAGWVVIDVPTSSCYVMFHHPQGGQVPGQGEKGYTVSGEAWIKDGIVSFNNKIVTSHIDLETGKKVSADVTKQYTNVSSNQIYTTSAVGYTGTVIAPANATGYYQAGISNVVYLYQGGEVTEPSTPTGKVLMGDADGDGKVTILDATRIQRVLAGLDQKSANYDVAADVDQDGKVTIIDATCIQRYLASLSNNNAKIDVWVGGGEDPSETPTEPPVTPTDAPENKMYLVPSDEWKEAGARFAAYFFDEEDDFIWVNLK